MTKIVIRVLLGSAVIQTKQDGLIMYLLVANFLLYVSAKNYEYQFTYFKVINRNKVGTF